MDAFLASLTPEQVALLKAAQTGGASAQLSSNSSTPEPTSKTSCCPRPDSSCSERAACGKQTGARSAPTTVHRDAAQEEAACQEGAGEQPVEDATMARTAGDEDARHHSLTSPISALASAATIAAIRLSRQSPTLPRDSMEVASLMEQCFTRQQRGVASGDDAQAKSKVFLPTAAYSDTKTARFHLAKGPTLPLAAIKRLMRQDSGASVVMVTGDAVRTSEHSNSRQ